MEPKAKSNIMYLLTEWEGRTRKYLARGQGVRTERSEVDRASWPRAKYFPFRPDLTQSISILSYDHLLLKFLKILFEPKWDAIHKIRRPRARNELYKSFYNKKLSFVSSRRTRNSQFIENTTHFWFSIAIRAKKPTESWHNAVKNMSKPSKT